MASHPDGVVPTPDALSNFQFDDSDRWTSTATDGGGLVQGTPTTLRWSIVPDGTSISGGVGEPASDSDLIAFLGGIYGVTTDDAVLTDEPWFPLFESYLNRWGEVSGLSYVRESNDDGSSITNFSSSPGGQIGVRGDIRISGHSIDGEAGQNTLAYNYYPNHGDMVIDTDNVLYFGNTSSTSLRLRNVLGHEHGHGVGIAHVCPVISSADGRLMEPIINLNFDGPQFDDILAVQRGYGDALEKFGNDTSSGATDLGTLLDGQTIRRGTDAADNRVSPTETDFISIDDDSDVDFFSFTIGSNLSLDLVLTPRGPSYLSGPQNSNGTCSAGTTFDASAQSDLTLELVDSDGTTVLQTSDVQGTGGAEALSDLLLPAGTYFLRITGADDAAQMYEITLAAAQTAGVSITQTDGDTRLTESGSTDSYTIALSATPAGPVEVTVTADLQTEISRNGTDFFSSVALTFNDMTLQTVTVRAIDDATVEGLHAGTISHAITATADSDQYPTGHAIADVAASISDNDIHPFQRTTPLGGLIFVSSNNLGTLASNSDFAEFAFDVAGGQTISAVVETGNSALVTVELVGVSDAFTAPEVGASVVLPPTAIATDGTYTLRLTGDGTTDYNLNIYRNAALESQVGDSSSGNELNIDGSLVQSSFQRYGVIGNSDPVTSSNLQFTQYNDPGLFVDISITGTALGLGGDDEIEITTTVGNSVFPAGTVTIGNNGGIMAGGGADLKRNNQSLPSASLGNALLPFWDNLDSNTGDVYWEERQVGGVNTLIVQWEDRPHFRRSGDATFQLQLFESGPVSARLAYKDVVFGDSNDFGAGATIGLQLSPTSAVPFSHNSPTLSNGDILDLASDATPEIDEYEIDFSGKAGHLVDIVLAGHEGADFSSQILQLLDIDGLTVLATGATDPLLGGTDATNYDLAILGFSVPADGVYTLHVSSTVADAVYGIVITESLSFDTEPNNIATTDSLRNLTATQAALGHLDAPGDRDDYYEIDLALDQTVALTTQTLFDSVSTTPLNDLDPEIQVIHPDGSTIVVTDLDSASDEKNAFVGFAAPEAGTYQIRVRATSGSGQYLLAAEDYTIDDRSADFDEDGFVDGDDFLIWQLGVGTSGGASVQDGDADGDGDVDVEDLSVWSTQFGQATSTNGAPSVAVVDGASAESSVADTLSSPAVETVDSQTMVVAVPTSFTGIQRDSALSDHVVPAGFWSPGRTDEALSRRSPAQYANDEQWTALSRILAADLRHHARKATDKVFTAWGDE